MNTKRVNTAADVILAALTQNRTAAGIALALESAGLLLTADVQSELNALDGARLSLWEEECASERLRVALESAKRGRRELRARGARLEGAAVEGRAALASLCYDLDDPGTAALGALYLLQQATVGTVVQPLETTPTVYRASHDSIAMGLYITAAAAREHCETLMRRESPDINLDWIEDEEDGVAEMTAWLGGEECTTGYVVTALAIASAYDPDADE
ncbi:hypothetical protein [Streptomyces sp. NPDC096311]|uniref:hypothetical protein n=1 Tax=Streptomyces sp. NPDC096311 TaxID=3366083 RepID=UPI0038180B0C